MSYCHKRIQTISWWQNVSCSCDFRIYSLWDQLPTFFRGLEPTDRRWKYLYTVWQILKDLNSLNILYFIILLLILRKSFVWFEMLKFNLYGYFIPSALQRNGVDARTKNDFSSQRILAYDCSFHLSCGESAEVQQSCQSNFGTMKWRICWFSWVSWETHIFKPLVFI
jgi:hypothetical protein